MDGGQESDRLTPKRQLAHFQALENVGKRTGGADHARAAQHGELDRGAADASGGAALLPVTRIDTRRAHRNPDLARPRMRIREIHHLEDLRAPEFPR